MCCWIIKIYIFKVDNRKYFCPPAFRRHSNDQIHATLPKRGMQWVDALGPSSHSSGLQNDGEDPDIHPATFHNPAARRARNSWTSYTANQRAPGDATLLL
mmetsp:Transcript_10263/g.20657  ORF Transcript_10263/g.20657 Transcript_10263/m.20657 type:complete len:100 (+) Transcript_10263:489-788(+)